MLTPKNSLKEKLGLTGKNKKPGLKSKLVSINVEAKMAERPKAKKPLKVEKVTKRRKK